MKTSKKKNIRLVGSKDEPIEELQDDELVDRSRDGDEKAYRELVTRYQQRAFRIAYDILRRREDAEDAVQEAFVKAYLSLSSFRGQSSFYTWLYRIVYNMSIDFKRKQGRGGGPASEFKEEILNENPTASSVLGKVEAPEAVALRKEQGKRIQQALAELSEEHRAVITLREFEGMSYDEIAECSGVSKGTIMSRLHYARKKMQELLKDLVEN